ncbi:MAG: SRPBCC domain-containing protein [Ruegeria sp.]|uniref:SRPBCC family protein n=1 Tax=Ruegeria sp. TaxID=1879320 RepID=UPI00349EE7BF
MNIDKEYELPFPVSEVFTAWVSSETIIPPASRMNIEPVPGGCYELFMDGPDGGASNRGRFHLVQPNERLVYTWEWNGDGEVTVIDVTFQSDGPQTRLRLSHRGFLSEDSAKMHDAGWDSYIQGLTDHIRRQR